MAQDKGGGGLAGAVGGLREMAGRNPATERLLHEAEGYLAHRAKGAVRSLTDRVADASDSLDDGGTFGSVAKEFVGGANPVSAVAKGVGKSLKDKFGSKGGAGGVKAVHIAEHIDIGVPLEVAYDQWTQFTEFGQFTKGVQSVDQTSEVEATWRAKVFWSTRSWTAKISEQVPDERIAWTSDGEKGSLNGVVTFHELGDPPFTRVLLEIEYHPKGLFERTGNIWRAQGRRARLDLKHFRRFVMMRNEATGSWRGEIRDGEVVSDPDDAGGEEQWDERDDDQRAGGREADGDAYAGEQDPGERDGLEQDEPDADEFDPDTDGGEPAGDEAGPDDLEEPDEVVADDEPDERPRRRRRREPAGAGSGGGRR